MASSSQNLPASGSLTNDDILNQLISVAKEVVGEMTARAGFDSAGTREWSIPLLSIAQDLQSIGAGNIPSPPDQQEGLLRFLNKHGHLIERHHVQLMPAATRLEYFKVRVAELETAHHVLFKPKPSSIQVPQSLQGGDLMSPSERAVMFRDVARGLRLVCRIRANIRKLAWDIREVANASPLDAEAGLRLKREQCIMAVVSNTHLVMALCDCAKLDPRHDLRNHLQSTIDDVLGNSDYVKAIDEYIDTFPEVFDSVGKELGIGDGEDEAFQDDGVVGETMEDDAMEDDAMEEKTMEEETMEEKTMEEETMEEKTMEEETMEEDAVEEGAMDTAD